VFFSLFKKSMRSDFEPEARQIVDINISFIQNLHKGTG
jgi:hypothetical protein